MTDRQEVQHARRCGCYKRVRWKGHSEWAGGGPPEEVTSEPHGVACSGLPAGHHRWSGGNTEIGTDEARRLPGLTQAPRRGP